MQYQEAEQYVGKEMRSRVRQWFFTGKFYSGRNGFVGNVLSTKTTERKNKYFIL